MTLLGVILGAIIAWWAWRLAGAVAAVVATAAFCLDPNFLAHTPLIKNDVAITLMFVGLMAIVWLLGERVTIWRGIAAGLLLGAAITTKFSGILGIPVLMIALCSRALLPQPWTALKWIAQSRLAQTDGRGRRQCRIAGRRLDCGVGGLRISFRASLGVQKQDRFPFLDE